jgi:hypothetical protein
MGKNVIWDTASADDVNVLGNNINTINENLTDNSKEVGLEVNTEKAKYELLSRYLNAGQNRDTKIVNRSFGNVSKFLYLGMALQNQNFKHNGINSRLNWGNACYHSVPNPLSSRLLWKDFKLKY